MMEFSVAVDAIVGWKAGIAALAKRVARIALVLSLGSVPAGAIAGETVVTLENGIVGTLNVPDHTAPVPAVLMLHGFGSSRDEVGGMFSRTATALAMKGIASLRIDFAGFGKSEGDTGSTTIDSQLEQAKAALAILRTTEDIDASRLGILGFSLGGGVATILASERQDQVKSLATWSSVGDFEEDFRSLLGEKAFARAKEDGVVGLDLGWRTIALKQAFFDSLSKYKIDSAITSFPGAYLTIVGEKDFSAAYADRFVGLSKSSVKEEVVVPDGDHIFKVLGSDQSMAKGVIDKTADWFSKTL